MKKSSIFIILALFAAMMIVPFAGANAQSRGGAGLEPFESDSFSWKVHPPATPGEYSDDLDFDPEA